MSNLMRNAVFAALESACANQLEPIVSSLQALLGEGPQVKVYIIIQDEQQCETCKVNHLHVAVLQHKAAERQLPIEQMNSLITAMQENILAAADKGGKH